MRARSPTGGGVTLGGERLGVRIDGLRPRQLAARVPRRCARRRSRCRRRTARGRSSPRPSAASGSLIASLLNLDAVTEAARAHGDDVAIFCAGVKGSFALDDSYVAGRIAGLLGGDRTDAAEAAVRLAASYATRRGGLPRLAQRPQPDQPRAGARGGHPVLRPRERARRRARASPGCTASPPRSAPRLGRVRAAVVLFTRDLRVHDNPALARPSRRPRRCCRSSSSTTGIGATRYGAAANRRAFLLESLADLDASLRGLGAALDVRRGDVVAETVRAAREVGATTVFASADVSPYARERERRLAAALDLRLVDGSFVVPPGEVDAGGHRPLPGLLALPPRLVAGAVRDRRAPTPRGDPACPARRSSRAHGSLRCRAWHAAPCCRAARRPGVERARRVAADASRRVRLRRPRRDRRRRDLAALALPPLRLRLAAGARRAGTGARRRGVRAPALLARLLRPAPARAARDARSTTCGPRGDRWLDDPDALAAWKEGMTGYPARRRRHAPAAPGGLDAQPRAHGGGVVPRQGSRDRLARGRAALLRPAARRRRGAERRQLAVGRRHRRRHAPEPRLQPDRAAEEARPRGRLRAPLRAGARGRARAGHRRAGPARARRIRRPIVDHAEAVEAFRRRRGLG